MNEVDQYISTFPAEVQKILIRIRTFILELSPEATESFSYGMPAYKTYGKPLVYFAAFKNHIGLYATPSGHQKFSKQLAQYKQGKGSVQFPLKEPIPYDLIKEVIAFRVQENLLKAKEREK